MSIKSDNISAVLLLEDGTIYQGIAIGKKGITSGEICFNTGMSGYQEIFTDPSYSGQVMVMANTHIGNYGVEKDESESTNSMISGLVCKDYSDIFSRTRSSQSLDEFLLEKGITGIQNVDTRNLVEHIRDHGAMNCIISSDVLDIEVLKEMLKDVPSMQGLELSSKVSTKEVYDLKSDEGIFQVAVLDFGVKKSILNCMLERGCNLTVYPSKTTYEEVSSKNPDAYFLSNGPGDPAVMMEETKVVKSIIESGKPVFGICLGHQLLGQALGLETFKMHHGHRGINHPVKNLVSGKCEITSQNHGFAIHPGSLQNNLDVEVTHVNLNDDSIEGIKVKNTLVFSVQYHPEASPGPLDSRYLFDDFVQNIHQSKQKH
jgi:carbamoyl-phosphate synthase small subunit